MKEFDWLIHYKCNYRCPYCFFEGSWDMLKERVKYRPLEDWVSAWKNIFNKYGEFKITITGGEPMIYPEFGELVRELNKLAHVSFDTNLSLSEQELKKFVSKADPGKMFMGVSFHPLFADVETFTKKAKILKDNGFNIRVHYVTYPPQLQDIEQYQDRFIKGGFRFTPLPFRGTFEGKVYPVSFDKNEKADIGSAIDKATAEDGKWADKLLNQVESRNKVCRAGKEYARVDSDGKVFACANDQHDIVGDIFADDFSLRDEYKSCRVDKCPCEFRLLVEEPTR